MIHLSFINLSRAWNFTGDVGKRRDLEFVAHQDDGNGPLLYTFTLVETRKYGERAVDLEMSNDAFRAFTDAPELFAFLAEHATLDFDELVARIADVYDDITNYDCPYV